ncbi:MAG TPA: IS110 family transposase [Parafilimonas sp.]
MLSVPGIGRFTAVYLICCTNNFAAKYTGKQLAGYAGVVPFDHTSGTSIKSKNRVHKMANKDLKQMLHLCALTAIKCYPEFTNYFNRKKAEGKNGMSVLNAIRNKIVLRAIAVVNKQAPYVDYTKQAA